ncbi:uncharacterized protein LOC141951115 [Strix uralensis]|uniref:uncharacterized protein LOC141951115 n=1 Tax=Strix uralensis TaxID=36305 RepID=UPI003DA78E10
MEQCRAKPRSHEAPGSHCHIPPFARCSLWPPARTARRGHIRFPRPSARSLPGGRGAAAAGDPAGRPGVGGTRPGIGTPGTAGLAEPRAVRQPRLGVPPARGSGAVLGVSAPTPTHPHPHPLLARHPGSMSAAKSKRIKFSEEEKFLILEEFSLRKDILIPKSGRYKHTLDRQRAWEEIAAAVNNLSPLVQRTPDEIRKKWHNMVLDARRELAVEKHPLLRQRPQERLFHNIFALFNKPSPGLPDPLLSASPLRARADGSPLGVLEAAPDLLLHGQSSTASPGHDPLCPTGTPPAPGPAPESLLGAAAGEPNSKENLLPAGPQASVEERLTPPDTAPATPSLPTAGVLPAAAPCPASVQIQGAAGMAPVPLAGSPETPMPVRIKAPLSPMLVSPCLSAMASPAMQSRGTASPSPPAPEENGHPSAPEGSQPGLGGCVGTAGERWEKQSRLQTEILELQKETLQLQKEKILLEKEKLFLEIIKLRRELGT